MIYDAKFRSSLETSCHGEGTVESAALMNLWTDGTFMLIKYASNNSMLDCVAAAARTRK